MTISQTQQFRTQVAMEELLRRWEKVKVVRNKCRRSLVFLCNYALGYKDVIWNGPGDVHEEIIQNLQKFPHNAEDVLDKHGQCTVIPNKPLWELSGPRNTLILYPRGHLKALRVDTQIPTPEGFTPIGNLRVGDKVFGADGSLCTVTGVSEPVYREDVYEIEFSTGDLIVADAGHLWETESRREYDNTVPKHRISSVKTTEEIANSVDIRGERNHRIRVAGPLDLPERPLPLAPYVLGAWLGDGTSSTGSMTIGEQDEAELTGAIASTGTYVEKCNVKLRFRLSSGNRHTMKEESTSAILRRLNLLANKHIPPVYLRASFDQRLELLQGLMDTDGTISKAGQCSFTNMNNGLVRQVRELICSLGLKCSSVYSWPAVVNGKNCGDCFTISFYTYPEVPVFKLSRKRERIRERRQVSLQSYRQIRAVRRAEPCMVRCIAVDSQDALYLAGESFIPTHNTTIITIAHTIQWIINYPNVRILISTATGDQCKKMLLEIKSHFQFNTVFRSWFPDFCPQAKKAADFGSQEEFTVPNRTVHRKEPTVSTCSVGKVIAGSHYEVIKNSDLVDKENVKTPGQIADVISHFGYLNPLLERSEIAPYHGWVDVEGTRYDFGDLYGRLLDSGTYRTVVRPRPGEESVWPARFPMEELRRIEKEIGPYIFSCQYKNKPIPPEGGLCDPKDIVFLPRGIIHNILPTLRIHCTVDLHGMEPAKNNNDFTVLNVHGFDRDGRMYIVDVRRGRFTPFQVIDHIFDIQARWNPIDFKVEKDAHARVLLPFFQREASKRQKFPILSAIPRNTHVSKQQRIRGLQPWFRNGIIRFSDDLGCKSDIMLEIMQFPSQSAGVHDDFLDTCADAMTNQEGEVNDDVVADLAFDPQQMFGMQKPRNRFLEFNQDGTEHWLYGNEEQKTVYAPTGVL